MKAAGTSILILCESKLIKGTLKSWKDHLRWYYTNNKEDKIGFLKESLDIFKGRIYGLADVPDEDEIREGIMTLTMKENLRE
jgi:hypothetical protein